MVNNSIDRLSYLPDSIIDHILSFLDTKLVVQASVLSKRWKCTWKQVYVLRFHNPSFCSYLDLKGMWARFSLFIFHFTCTIPF
ncbi:Putative FBD-associated F-box protein At5g56440 [Linum grandiflorum]